MKTVQELNNKKVPTRLNGKWRESTIKLIIVRQKKLNQNRSGLNIYGRCNWKSALDSFASPQGTNSSHHRISGIQMAGGHDVAWQIIFSSRQLKYMA